MCLLGRFDHPNMVLNRKNRLSVVCFVRYGIVRDCRWKIMLVVSHLCYLSPDKGEYRTRAIYQDERMFASSKEWGYDKVTKTQKSSEVHNILTDTSELDSDLDTSINFTEKQFTNLSKCLFMCNKITGWTCDENRIHSLGSENKGSGPGPQKSLF
jgi:hypothetical protein